MRKHRFLVWAAITGALALVYSGIAVADPSVGQKLPPTPIHTAAPVPGSVANAINNLGLTKYQNLYAGDSVKPDGSVTVMLGPGTDTSFTRDLASLTSSSAIQAFGPVPTIANTRVPASISVFNTASSAMNVATNRLEAAGFVPAYWSPDLQGGTLDITLSSAPDGMSTVAATAYLRQAVSQYVTVTSVNAPPEKTFLDRGHDIEPWYASDLIRNTGSGAFCTTGFSVIGTSGQPRASTAAHCNENGSNTFTNGGYYAPGTNPCCDFPVPDGTPQNTLGFTSNYALGGDADVQFLEDPVTPGSGDGPYVWIGFGTAQPYAMAVGGGFANYPAGGQPLTTDGAFTRTVRYVPVIQAGQSTCFNGGQGNICGMIELQGTSQQGVSPTAQPGDSGGPLFCFACYPNVVSPVGLIEGGSSPGQPIFATYIGNDLGATGGYIYTSG